MENSSNLLYIRGETILAIILLVNETAREAERQSGSIFPSMSVGLRYQTLTYSNLLKKIEDPGLYEIISLKVLPLYC